MPKSPAKDNKKSGKPLFSSSAGIVMNFHHSAVAKVRVMFFRTGERARYSHVHQKTEKKEVCGDVTVDVDCSNPTPDANNILLDEHSPSNGLLTFSEESGVFDIANVFKARLDESAGFFWGPCSLGDKFLVFEINQMSRPL